MATYSYRCPDHGDFDVVKPMVESGREEFCDAPVVFQPCGKAMQRVYTAPMIQGETVPGGITGGSGDGYLFNSKSGLRSRGKRERWV